MLHVLTVIAPMFILLGVGMIAGFSERFRSAQPGINAFVFYFSLPAFLFTAVASAPIADGVPLAFVGVSIGVTAALFAALYSLASVRKNRGELAAGPFAVAGTFGNVGYLGVPIVMSIVGPHAALGAALGQLLHNVLFMVGYPLLKVLGRERQAGSTVVPLLWRVAKRSILLNPVVLSVGAGVIVGLYGVPLPDVVTGSVAMLGQAAIPCAMFAVGLTIKPAFEGVRSKSVPLGGVVVASVAKLIVLPMATLGVALAFSGAMAPEWVAAAVIMAAMPVSSSANIMVYEYDGDARLTGATTLVTSICAVVTIPLVIAVLG